MSGWAASTKAYPSNEKPAKYLDIPAGGELCRFERVAGADKCGREPLGTYAGTVGRWSVTLRHVAVCAWTFTATRGERELESAAADTWPTPILALSALLAMASGLPLPEWRPKVRRAG